MKAFILVLFLSGFSFCQPPKNSNACKISLPRGVFVRQMQDNTWIIYEGDEDGISYYFVGSNSPSTGWIWCDCGTCHYSDSCSAKAAFKKFMDHIHFK